MLVIRKVDIAHVPIQQAIASLHDECYPPPDDPYVPRKGHWWVAFKGKTAVAFAGICESLQMPEGAYLCRAGVLPGHRGDGIQKKLIKKRLQFARKNGWSTVVTDTNLNPASANSLIACGFRMYTPAIPWSFPTACYWRKSIAQ